MKPKKPRILLIRDAAIGDVIMITPLVRSWADRGYDVHVACKKHVGDAVFPFNPHIARLHRLDSQDTMGMRKDRIKQLRDKLKPSLVLDLAGTCEGSFLYHSSRQEYHLPLSTRRANAEHVNYYEYICKQVGGGDRIKPELYAGSAEDNWWARFRALRIGWRFVQVQCSGSSINKCYPWWPMVIKQIQDISPRVMVVTTGDPTVGKIIEMAAVEHGADPHRIWSTCGSKNYKLRDSLIMTKYVDCVIGPETGVINASGCFDTPKVVLLSHSNAYNLCKGWDNCYPIQGQVDCSPCYRIVSSGDSCPCGFVTEEEDERVAGAARCMASIPPELVVNTVREALKNGR